MKKLITTIAFIITTFCSRGQAIPIFEPDPTFPFNFPTLYGYTQYEDVYGSGQMLERVDSEKYFFYQRYIAFNTVALASTPVTTATGFVGVDDYGVLVRINSTYIDPTPFYLTSTDRTLGTAYKESTTNSCTMRLNSQVSCNLSLTGGQAGNLQLQISSSSSGPWNTVGILPSSNIGTLTIGLNTTQVSGGQMTVDVPANYWWRLVSTNTTGTPTYSFLGGVKEIH